MMDNARICRPPFQITLPAPHHVNAIARLRHHGHIMQLVPYDEERHVRILPQEDFHHLCACRRLPPVVRCCTASPAGAVPPVLGRAGIWCRPPARAAPRAFAARPAAPAGLGRAALGRQRAPAPDGAFGVACCLRWRPSGRRAAAGSSARRLPGISAQAGGRRGSGGRIARMVLRPEGDHAHAARRRRGSAEPALAPPRAAVFLFSCAWWMPGRAPQAGASWEPRRAAAAAAVSARQVPDATRRSFLPCRAGGLPVFFGVASRLPCRPRAAVCRSAKETPAGAGGCGFAAAAAPRRRTMAGGYFAHTKEEDSLRQRQRARLLAYPQERPQPRGCRHAGPPAKTPLPLALAPSRRSRRPLPDRRRWRTSGMTTRAGISTVLSRCALHDGAPAAQGFARRLHPRSIGPAVPRIFGKTAAPCERRRQHAACVVFPCCARTLCTRTPARRLHFSRSRKCILRPPHPTRTGCGQTRPGRLRAIVSTGEGIDFAQMS